MRTVTAVLSGRISQSVHLGLEVEGVTGHSARIGLAPAPQLFQAFIHRGVGVHGNLRDKDKCPSRERGPDCPGGADSGGSARWFGPRESSWLLGSRRRKIGPVAQSSLTRKGHGGSGFANRHRAAAESAQEYSWLTAGP